MGYLRMTARKILRRSKPHGPRGKRIEPTVEQGLRDIEDDAELDQREIDEMLYGGPMDEWDDDWEYNGSIQEQIDEAYGEDYDDSE